MATKHHKPNREYVQKTRQTMGTGEWFTPEKDVKNQVRVLPAWDERGICVVKRVLHYGFEVDGRARAFPCLEENLPWLPKSPCPICHVISKMEAGDKEEREAAEELKAGSARFVVQIIDCKHPEKGRLFWAAPFSFGKYFTGLLEDEDIDDITDPEEGYDIIVEVSGKGRGTKYEYRVRPKASPIPYENWEEELEDLVEMIDVRKEDGLIDLLKENYGNAFDIDAYLEDFGTRKAKAPKEDDTEEEKKPKKEKKADTKYTVKEIEEMGKKELRAVIKENDLGIKGEDWEGIKELRALVIQKLGLSAKKEKSGDDDSDYTVKEIKGLKKSELLALVEEEELPIDDEDWGTLDELKELVIEELKLEE